MTIALRRHHRERLKKARKGYWGFMRRKDGHKMSATQLGIVVDTPTPCSCWCCGCHRSAHGKPFWQVKLEQGVRED